MHDSFVCMLDQFPLRVFAFPRASICPNNVSVIDFIFSYSKSTCKVTSRKTIRFSRHDCSACLQTGIMFFGASPIFFLM